MRIYEIPIIVRYAYIGDGKYFPSKSKYLEIDGIGAIIYYDREEQLKLLNRNQKFIEEKSLCFVEAEDSREAIIRFFLENKETAIGGGGEDLKTRAVYINTKEIILQFPLCPIMHKNVYGEFICGLPALWGGCEGDFGMCVIEDDIQPKNCTFISFKKRFLKDYEKYEKITERTLGFKVLSANQVKPAEFSSITL